MPTETGDPWQSLSQHLDQVLDLAEEQRASWLESLQGRDPEMAGLVSAALAARDREGFAGFLEGAPPLPLEDLAKATLIGRQVGAYVIDAEIGRGGMGSVWRAHRIDGLYEGTVAVKFVHAAWIGRAGEQRFRIEGNLLGRLDHANIARLIDAGMLEGAQPYLILEYVEGEPIDSYCEREMLGLEQRVNLFLGVLAAVEHAHTHLIVHRDIKPSNIFVGRGGVVKLLDFGIAKLLQDETAAATPTLSNAVPLTPQYAAPEQLLGKPVTTVTDVYSLGLVLYTLLTGAHPIAGENISSVDFMRAVLTEEPARASAVAVVPTIRRRSLEGDLDNILRKALKKDPKERYASVGAFAEDLRRFLTHEPVQARADTIPYRVSKFVRRHRGGVVSALLVALGLIGTSAVALWQLYQANLERDISQGEMRRTRGLAELNSFMLSESTLHAPPQETRERLDRAVDFVEHNYQGEKDVMASLLFGLGSNYVDIGEADLASKTTAKGDAIVEHLDDIYMKAESGCRRAHDFAMAHDLPTARVRLAKAMQTMGHLHVIAPGLRANCGTAGALIAQADGDYANATVNIRAVLASLEQEQAYASNSWVAAQNDLARTQYMAGDFRGAWNSDSVNLRVAKERGLTDSGRYFAMASVGCNTLRHGGQPLQSRSFVDSIRDDVRREVANAELPFFLVGCRALAELVMDLPNPPVAALARAASTAKSAGMASMANTFGSALVDEAVKRGDLAAAESGWAQWAPDEKKMLDAKERGPDVVRLLLLHANLDIAHGQSSEALQRIDQAADLIAARHQPSNSDSRDIEMLRIRATFVSHQFAAAIRHAQAALEIARSSAIDPQSSAWIGEALLWRARAEAALGDKAKAKATAREALPHLEQNMDPASDLIAGARDLVAT